MTGRSSRLAQQSQGDTGAGTILAIALLAVVGLVALLGAAMGGAALAHVRAQGVADLAALSAAHAARDALAAGTGGGVVIDEHEACAMASTAADMGGVEITSCKVDKRATVRVEARIETAWGDARAVARAGLMSAAPNRLGNAKTRQ